MSEKSGENLIGFYASFNAGETDQDLVKSYLWSENGFQYKLAHLNWKKYGTGLQKILFQIYVKPIPFERKNLREIEKYRPKEESIGIPIILDKENFFNLSESQRQQFFADTILEKLGMVELQVTRNNLDFNISLLIDDVKKSLNYTKEYKSTFWSSLKSIWT